MQAAHKEACLEILNNLQSDKYYEKTRYFLSPVQETIEDSEWQLYKTIIKVPKDLRTITEQLSKNKYTSLSAFSKDVDLCFENAIKYNKQRYEPVYQAALALQKVFKAQMDKLVNNLPRGLTLPPPAAAPPAAAVPPPPPPPVAVPLLPLTSFDTSLGMSLIDSVSALKACQWFVIPLDTTALPLYLKRIPFPIDLPTIKENLLKRKYVTPDLFALDMRRTFANSLVYHFDLLNAEYDVRKIRADAKTCLFKFEQEWQKLYDGRISPVGLSLALVLPVSISPLCTPASLYLLSPLSLLRPSSWRHL
jgi:hypothetical protein